MLKFLKNPKVEKAVSTIAVSYFMIGLLFAITFAIYYKWPALSFLSPPFFHVILTWPFQVSGFVSDLLYYGLAGKTF